MPVPTDPYPNFQNGVDTADGDQVDARFKALFDAFNPAAVGIDSSNIVDGSIAKADLAPSALQAFLQLLVNGDHKLAFGKVAVPAGFGGTRYSNFTIAHGLGGTPEWAHVSSSYAPSTNTSTAQNEPSVSTITGLSETDIAVTAMLPPGVTCSSGPGAVWWAAIA